jgi:hypothetical protein
MILFRSKPLNKEKARLENGKAKEKAQKQERERERMRCHTFFFYVWHQPEDSRFFYFLNER